MAETDSTSFNCAVLKTLNVIGNDTDADGNLPLSLVSVTSGSPASIWASVFSSTSIQIGANAPGIYTLSYVVTDSLGATATGTVNVTVTGNPNTCQPGPD